MGQIEVPARKRPVIHTETAAEIHDRKAPPVVLLQLLHEVEDVARVLHEQRRFQHSSGSEDVNPLQVEVPELENLREHIVKLLLVNTELLGTAAKLDRGVGIVDLEASVDTQQDRLTSA